jgi:hypothetical protein
MKTIYKAAMLAALGLASVTTLKASSDYDLILGFTQQGGNTSGNDFMLDIGPVNPYPGASGLFNGETWNLSGNSDFAAQGFSLSAVEWGIIGDANNSDGSTPSVTWVTTAGNAPGTISSEGAFGAIETPINSIEQQQFGGGAAGYVSNAGQDVTPGSADQNSWNQQTINGTLNTQFINAYGNPNVTGETSETLWQVTSDGSAPTEVGIFTLDPTGGLTFNTVPEPSTTGLLSIAGGLVALVWRNRFACRQA